ncbi:MAG: single-stranded-DNA-specific exonuclease RecJ [Dehalococcoidia bacterium]|nr:single-stranded-DNA-specific exonuclease RecJ [Dehalococcoidia bacterium]
MPATTATGKVWKLHPKAPALQMGKWDIPPVISQLLYNRGITTPAQLEAFLEPARHYPSDPFDLPGIGPAVERILAAQKREENVGIFGDFDVDGIAGTAIVAQGLQELGLKVFPYIPDRVAEGHGLNTEALQAMKEMGNTVLITVDCGISSASEVAFAQDMGMDVIVTDHHAPPAFVEDSPAMAIINPQMAGEPGPFSDLSGGGLALKLMQAAHMAMGKELSPSLYELAAMSTVADLVPLRGENRYIVQQGVARLRNTRRPGLQALFRRARIRPEAISAETVGFSIAPRLNAAGRLQHASSSYRLLTTPSLDEAETLADQLEQLNRERQRRTAETWSRAQAFVLEGENVPPFIVYGDDDVLPGIAGLIAGRLVDRFHRPSLVLSKKDGALRGSARSIPGFNLARSFDSCGDLLLQHGGHSMAAGLEVSPEKLPALEQRLQRTAEDAIGTQDLEPCLEIDAEAPAATLVGEAYKWLEAMEPFGPTNRTPVFLSRNLEPVHVRPIGERGQHLKIRLRERGVTWDATAFDLGERWPDGVARIDAAYTLSTEQRGDTRVVVLKLLDFRPSHQP